MGVYLPYINYPDSTAYIIPYYCVIPKSIDVERLKQAIRQTVDAFPLLKTSIEMVEGQPVMIPHDSVSFDIPYAIISEAELETAKQTFFRAFVLEQAPLFCFGLYETEKALYFLINFHHTISDGSSMFNFLHAIGQAYNGLPIESEDVTMFTFASYEADSAPTPEMEADKAYFAERLTGIETQSGLRADLPMQPEVPGMPLPSGNYTYYIKQAGLDQVSDFVREHGLADSTPFLGAFAYTLARYSGNKDALFNTVHAGRRDALLKKTLGMFVHTTPIYTAIPAEKSVKEYLQTLKKEFVETLKHSNILSFADIVELTRIHSDPLFVYQGNLLSTFELDAHTIPFFRYPAPHAKNKLSLMVFRRKDGFELFFDYRSDLYSEALIHRFAQSMETVLLGMLAAPEALVNQLSIISPEQEKVLQGFREVATCPIDEPIVHRIFEKQVAQYGAKTALVATDATFTYTALNEQVNILAHSLIARGIRPQSKIIILLPRTSRVMISIMGILKTGSAYIPCDPDYPAERINHIMSDSGAGYIITTADRVNDFESGKAVDVEELLKGTNTANPDVEVSPEDYSYIIYTSGSTGKPKGVLLHHYGLANYVNPHPDNIHAYVMVSNADVFLCLTTVSFDVSVHEMFVPLCNGKTLIFAGDEEAHNPIALSAMMENYKVEYYGSTPSRLALHLELPEFCAALAKCKVIMVAGEKYSNTLHEKVKAITPARIIDGYGPTEITILSNASELSGEETVTVGRPLTNYINFIVDGDGNELPQDVVGELYIGGAGVAHGYNNLPEMTAERFVDYKGVRIYKSGDYARWTERGDVVILGRTDNQVKLRGLRIELGEIEAAIAKYPGIKSVVVVIKKINDNEQLCAYFVATSEIDVADLKDTLSRTLTQYMVPAAYVQLEKMPTTPNGKTDVKSLPEPIMTNPGMECDADASAAAHPLTFFETELSAIVSGIVGHDSFGITDDLLYRGLTSLSLIKLAMQVHKRFGYSPDAKKLMQGCSIIGLENEIQHFLMDASAKAAAPAATTVSVGEAAVYPLSQTQLGLYYDCMKRAGEMLYNIPMCLKVAADVDAAKLADAVNKALAAHPYLFTNLSFVGTEVQQLRIAPYKVEIPVQEMSDEAFVTFKAEFLRPFSLQKPGELFRFALVKTPTLVALLMDFHHIIFDGYSFNVFVDEVLQAYEGRILEVEDYSYFDFVADANTPEAQVREEEAQTYFNELLGNCENASELPADLHGAEEGQQEECRYYVDETKLDAFCRENSLSLSALFLAAAYYTVSRFANSKEVFLSTLSNGRSNLRIQRSAGMFVNTVPLAAKIEPIPVLEFIKRAKDSMLHAIEHEFYPYPKVVSQYNYAPNIMFAYQVGVFEQKKLNGQVVELENLELKAPKFKTGVFIEKRDGRLCINMRYNNALYTRYTMNNFAEAMATVIDHMIAAPQALLPTISLISPAQEEILKGFREVATCPLDELIVHRIFEKQVERYPAKMALIASDQRLTYRELNEQANMVAHSLIERGITPQSKVVILLPRTSRAIISILAILKTGSGYIPCDPEYPVERINHVLEDSNAGFIITTADRVADFAPGKAVDVELLLQGTRTDNPDVPTRPEDHSYIIYTSGSTGKPKGVLLHHKGLANYVNPHPANVHAHTMVENGEIFLCMTTVAFDVSVNEIFVSLCNGKTLVFANDDETHNPASLARLMEREHTDYYGSTPSRLAQLLEFPAFCEALSKCTVLMVAGEKYSTTLHEKVKKVTRAKIVNGYGPTEITILSQAAELSQETAITIGRPLTNYSSFVVDGDGNELPQGVVGELYIGGHGVAHGYNNLPEMTAERFVDYKGVRIYKSGDYAKWNEKGELIVLGRTDNQVKIRGLRVELGEIEASIAKYPGMKSVVVVIKKLNGVEHICTYFTATEPVDVPALKEFLKKSLTQYMVPTVYTQLDKLPTTPNGKTDVKSLPEPALVLENEYEAAANDTEQIFCDIFATILNMPKVGATDDFFELGGTSLLVTRIIIEAVAHNLNINYGDVFVYTTPRQLAKLFVAQETTPEQIENDPAQYNYAPLEEVLAGNNLDAFRNGEQHPIGNVLITGVTGFLGIHILYEFLKNETGVAYCLLRKGNFPSEESRLKSTLFYYFEDTFEELFGSRIIIVSGDITDKTVFTSEVVKNATIHSIINCAALVKHFSSTTDIEDVNYGGVLNIIEYCKASGTRLVQVSTSSVAGYSIDNVPDRNTKMSEQMIYYGQSLDNKYVHSKFLAERAVLENIPKGLKAKIMRVGNLSARHSDGEFQINFTTNSFMGRLRSMETIGRFPYSLMNKSSELTPIDCTAKSILLLMKTPDACCVFHPYNNHTVWMGDIINAMRKNGSKIEYAEEEEFRDALEEAGKDPEKARILSSMIAYQNMKGKSVVLLGNYNDYTSQILYRMGFQWPVTSDDYMTKFINMLTGLGFFHAYE